MEKSNEAHKLKEAFSLFCNEVELNASNRILADLIANNGFDQQKLHLFLEDHNLKRIESLKDETMILLLKYITYVLQDNFIQEEEAGHIRLLKKFLKIKEGDLFQYHYHEVVYLIKQQIMKIYEDDTVDRGEALQKVSLQELFDLGYDQFLNIVNEEVRISIGRGGNLENLDTFLPKT